MYVLIRKLYSRTMYVLMVLCWFTCIPQVMCTPTVVPSKTFNATKDARTICDIGRLEDDVSRQKIIRMLCHRTKDERMKVKDEFEKIKDDKYCSGKNIAEYIVPSDTGNHMDLIENAFKTNYKIYLDDFAYPFVCTITVDNATIIEILLSIPPKGKAKFRKAYDKAGYRNNFDEALSTIKGELGKVVIELSERERQPEKPVDQEQAKKDADLLFEERKKWDKDRSNLNRILMETPIKQLNATLFEFKQRHDNKPLEQLIDEKMKDDVPKRDAYKDMIYYGYNPVDYYARRLDDSLKSEFEYDRRLHRIIIIHSETDLVEIAAAFQARSKHSLIDNIEKQDWSYRDELLRCLLGEKGFEET